MELCILGAKQFLAICGGDPNIACGLLEQLLPKAFWDATSYFGDSEAIESVEIDPRPLAPFATQDQLCYGASSSRK